MAADAIARTGDFALQRWARSDRLVVAALTFDVKGDVVKESWRPAVLEGHIRR